MIPTPVSGAEFRSALDALLASLGAQGEGRLALAVSGGSDSMALLRLANAAYPRRIVALTVDHKLRAASAHEALQVADWCKPLGVLHRVLHWEGQKPTTGLQRRAREARYGLLSGAAAQLGKNGLAAPLIVAHTLDDQAETFLLRLAHGSGIGGLGGMRAATEIASVPPVPLLRPLLGFRREALRATLDSCEQAWIEDPSNEDPKFERVRLRRILPALESSGLDPESLARASRLMAQIDRLLLDEALTACPHKICPEGLAAFRPEDFAALPGQAAVRYLSHLIRVVGGEPYPPARASLDALAARMRAPRARGATLGGCRLRLSKGGWIIEREVRAAAGAPAKILSYGAIALWDNRFWVRIPSGLGIARVEPRGNLPAMSLGKKGPIRDFAIAESVAAFHQMSDRPAALFVGEARMQREIGVLWRQVMKDTSGAEYDAATVS